MRLGHVGRRRPGCARPASRGGSRRSRGAGRPRCSTTVRGHREADADRAAVRRQDRGVHADDLAVHVEQRPARVAAVDRGVGLDEVVVGARSVRLRAETMPDETEKPWPSGLPMAMHPVADAASASLSPNSTKGSGSSLSTLRSAMSVRGSVPTRVAGRSPPSKKLDADLVGALDDVVVRHDVAVGRDDEARAQRVRAALARSGPAPCPGWRSMKSRKKSSKGEPSGSIGAGPRSACDDVGRGGDVDHRRAQPARRGRRSCRAIMFDDRRFGAASASCGNAACGRGRGRHGPRRRAPRHGDRERGARRAEALDGPRHGDQLHSTGLKAASFV